ncbi:hypothetical protein GEMRC1_000769 [Eukaryota sp. GEM-RC1]
MILAPTFDYNKPSEGNVFRNQQIKNVGSMDDAIFVDCRIDVVDEFSVANAIFRNCSFNRFTPRYIETNQISIKLENCLVQGPVDLTYKLNYIVKCEFFPFNGKKEFRSYYFEDVKNVDLSVLTISDVTLSNSIMKADTNYDNWEFSSYFDDYTFQ